MGSRHFNVYVGCKSFAEILEKKQVVRAHHGPHLQSPGNKKQVLSYWLSTVAINHSVGIQPVKIISTFRDIQATNIQSQGVLHVFSAL